MRAILNEEVKNVTVSDLFVKIYENFNVVDQVENMNNLSEEELYLLLVYVLDRHSDEDPVVVHNLQPFKEKVMEIYELQDDKETNNTVLLELVEKTGDKYIETDYVVDGSGNKLKDPLTKEEVREAKIDIIGE
jgi:Fe-S-cluster formation regulator IscX/YfhJ